MAILYDARGNPVNVSFPDAVTNETITDARPITAVLSALNGEVLMDLNGAAVALFDVRTAAGAMTLVFEGTVDGVNYLALPAMTLATAAAAPAGPEVHIVQVVIATTWAATYVVGVSGLRRIRIRVSAYTSGTVTIAARASGADYLIYSKPLPATLWVTGTAAANTALTLTLPAAGPGLFHYLVALYMNRNATAALAGTATLVMTSTNLPGNPAWSVGNAMAAGGTQSDVVMEHAQPIKSLVANTATTFVMPAPGAAVLWRANAVYYVGA
jgi:hypothetical protein